MQTDHLLKHLLLALLAALALYGSLFYGIEHRRTRSGPWRIRFTVSTDGVPALGIEQARLGITNVEVAFPGARASTASNPGPPVVFAEARPVPFDVPFGRCVFQDTTSLPGTVVLQLFGHEIQLLPRVLTIDGAEHPWLPQEHISLAPTNRLREGSWP